MITSCAVVAATCIGGTYAFTKDQFEKTLAQYKESNEYQLPKLLKDLREISSTLNQQLKEKAEWDRLRAFEAQHAKEFTVTQQALEDAQQRLKAVEGETVYLKVQETAPLGEPGLLIGFQSTSLTGDTAYVYVGEKSFSLKIGQSTTYQTANYVYTISAKAKKSFGWDFLVVRHPKTTP
jgi:hypothetical protein